MSIVIPALDEGEAIARVISAVRGEALEVIVVDGGSHDDTVDVARANGARVLRAKRGRASQMNAGAGLAQGDVVVFLHADTLLPEGWHAAIVRTLARTRRGWGRFDVRFDSSGPMLAMVSSAMNARSALTGICTGDQAMFVSRSIWRQVDGFAPISLMEDIELSARLRRLVGRPARIRPCATTSSRRWRERGVVRTIIEMWVLRAAFRLGVDPERLYRRYYG
ncbi:MAG: TIGR04283 family arsenosugar biosynthesis glycosyltransferase [Burkholderiaceae bacterium]|nr:TIGR04283 family arsenosugar biosynthesis glycosyltransferase [Burkholderiaceae bacterium]